MSTATFEPGGAKTTASPQPFQVPNFRVIIAMMLVGLTLSIFFSFRPEDTGIPIADVSQIPRDLGDWKYVQDSQVDPEIMKQMKADAFIDRIYVNPKTRQNVEFLVVYRRYGRREFAHRPELCYPAGGYTIIKKGRTTLPYAGRDREAIWLLADGRNVSLASGGTGVPTTTVSYLFASGDRTECDFIKQQIWMAFERLIPNKNGWTFIRLSSMRSTNDDDSLAAQQDFMRTYGPAIQQVITTDSTASPVAAAAPPASSSAAFGTFK